MASTSSRSSSSTAALRRPLAQRRDQPNEFGERRSRRGAQRRRSTSSLRLLRTSASRADAIDRRAVRSSFRPSRASERDRATKGFVVRRIGDELEVGHEVADLATIVEAHGADEAVRQRVAAQHFFHRATLCVRAIEHGDVVEAQRVDDERRAIISPTTKSASSRSSSERTTVIDLAAGDASREASFPCAACSR